MLKKLLRPKSRGQEMGCGHSGQAAQQQQQGSQEDLSLQSALLIQKWYRRFKARLEARRRAAWMIYQSIEYSSEASQLQLHNFFDDMLRLADADRKDAGDRRMAERLQQLQEEDDELLELTGFSDLQVEKSYKGPQLTFPVRAGQVQLLIDAFRSGATLHARHLLQLLHDTRSLFKSRPNVCAISTSISKRATVVGDLHGQIEDLFVVLYKNGLPDVTNPYVFNGDFVDRGGHSVETAAVIFACALAWPTAVFVNRGNHEDHVMNCRYGFVKEVQKKYKQHANKILRLFGDVFSWTPMATTIDEKIFVVHGGVSDKLDVESVQRIDRHRYLSALRPPVSESQTAKADRSEWRQVLDLLWSDPKPQSGCRPNTFRGGGSYFGPDVTEAFLRRHGFELLVRSHECKPEGWEFCHSRQVLTIFSASNYYDPDSNKGAFVCFDATRKPRIVQFTAGKVADMPPSRRLSAVEESALCDLRAKVAANHSELIALFRKLDPKATGYVKVTEWCEAMAATLKLDLPWRTLRPHLAHASKDGASVLYRTTFERTAVGQVADKDLGASVTESVYKNKEELETIFRLMDKDNSGQISLQEFKDSCRLLRHATQRPMAEEEVAELAKALDLNSDGFIDFNEFLEAFRIVDRQQQQQQHEELHVRL